MIIPGIDIIYTGLWFIKNELKDNLIFISLLIVLLIFSFVISGAEVALFSLSNKDLDTLKTKKHPEAKRIMSLLSSPREVYSSLLIAGTFVNICIIVLAGYLLNRFLPYNTFLLFESQSYNRLLELLIRVIIIGIGLTFVGQLFPKVWATQSNIRFAYGSAWVIEAIHLIFFRISKWSVKKSDNIYYRFGGNDTDAVSILEIEQAIDVQTDEETSPEEKRLIKGVVKFGHITVKQVMQNRIYVEGIEYSWSLDKIIEKINKFQYTRLAVYEENLDNIIGVINAKDLLPYLSEKTNFNWHTLIRPTFFVPETKLLDDLLLDFQSNKVHYAIVVDEFGGTSGIVTLYDIVEEVVGEIRDELDDGDGLIENYKIDDYTYQFDGRTMIIDMCKIMRLPSNTFSHLKGDSDSVGGLILEITGRFPLVGEEVKTGNYVFTVKTIENTRIRKVAITILNAKK